MFLMIDYFFYFVIVVKNEFKDVKLVEIMINRKYFIFNVNMFFLILFSKLIIGVLFLVFLFLLIYIIIYFLLVK